MSEISNNISDDLIDYVEASSNSFFVKKRINHKIITFGKFNSLKEACAAACILVKNKWILSEVTNSPLVNYEDEFFVFKVEENRLFLDKKFHSYEAAVEYMEINLRYNDFHNDIFSDDRKRKKREFKSDNEFLDEKFEDVYIQKENNKFIIEHNVPLDNFQYGEFNTLEEAKVAKKLLFQYKWNITNELEIFYENKLYWIFKFSEGVLILLNKFESYEDAFDYVDSVNNYENISYDKVIIKEPIIPKTEVDLFKTKNTLGKRSKSQQKTKRKKKGSPVTIYLKFSYDSLNNMKNKNVWTPKIKKSNMKDIEVIVKRGGSHAKKLNATLKFNFYNAYYDVFIESEQITLEENSIIGNFSEFSLIHYIFKTHDWDLSKIKVSSAIYFYDSKYYKILVLTENTIIFEEYESYYLAENLTLTIGKKFFTKNKFHCPLDITKVSKGYELVKIYKGNVFRMHPLSSLEEVKISYDILSKENWNLKIFKKYEYFYLNGLYWKFKVNDNEIRLISRLESI